MKRESRANTANDAARERDLAQDRFASRHGKSSMRRLHGAIEAVVQCAPLQGWNETLFYGSAVDLYLALLEVDQITADTMGKFLEKHQNHQVGT